MSKKEELWEEYRFDQALQFCILEYYRLTSEGK